MTNNNNDSNEIAAYLQSISKIPLLKRDEEIRCGRTIIQGRKTIIKKILSSKSGVDIFREMLERVEPVDEDEQQDAFSDYEKLRKVFGSTNDQNKLIDIILQVAQSNELVFTDALKEYSAQATHESILEAQKEIQAARVKLVNSNLRLVVSIAKTYTGTGMSFMDLIQEGTLGIMRAADKFDPDRGKFSTVATWWIRQAIIRALSNKLRTVRIPVHMVDAINRGIKLLTAKLGRNPTPEELRVELKMPHLTEGHVREVLGIMSGTISLDEQVAGDEDSDGTSMGERFADTSPLADEMLMEDDIQVKLLEKIKLLLPKEEKVLRLKIGL